MLPVCQRVKAIRIVNHSPKGFYQESDQFVFFLSIPGLSSLVMGEGLWQSCGTGKRAVRHLHSTVWAHLADLGLYSLHSCLCLWDTAGTHTTSFYFTHYMKQKCPIHRLPKITIRQRLIMPSHSNIQWLLYCTKFASHFPLSSLQMSTM